MFFPELIRFVVFLSFRLHETTTFGFVPALCSAHARYFVRVAALPCGFAPRPIDYLHENTYVFDRFFLFLPEHSKHVFFTMNAAPPGGQLLTICGTSASGAGGWDLAAPSGTYANPMKYLSESSMCGPAPRAGFRDPAAPTETYQNPIKYLS